MAAKIYFFLHCFSIADKYLKNMLVVSLEKRIPTWIRNHVRFLKYLICSYW